MSALQRSPSTDVLLERETHIEALEQAFGQARVGEGSALLLLGPAGIGKTRLLAAAGDLAGASGLRVLRGSGHRLEVEVDSGVLLQLFEAWLPERPSSVHAVYGICKQLAAEQPLALLVDDAHWSDEPSLTFLLYLARRLRELPIAIVLAAENSGLRTEAIVEVASHGAVTVLPIEPLSYSGVARRLRRGRFPRAHNRFCRACHEATGGNPFLLGELTLAVSAEGIEPSRKGARKVAEVGPSTVAQWALGRLRPLGDEGIRLAQAAALAGDDAELRHCAALAGLEPSAASRLADALRGADILRGSEQLTFVHPIVRQALHSQLAPGERAETHRQLAQLLRDEGASDETVAAPLLGATCTGSGWVVDVLAAAGEQALARGEPETAARYLRRALEEPPSRASRPGVMLGLGRAEVAAGEGEGVERLNEAVSLFEQPHERATTGLEIGRALWAQGRYADSARAFRAAAEEASDADAELRARLEMDHALVTRLAGLPVQPAEVESADPAVERVRLASAAFEGAQRGVPRDEVSRRARAALAGGKLMASETADGLGVYFAAAALALSDEPAASEAAVADAVADAAARGSVLGLATACYMRGWLALGAGRLDDAAVDAQRALAARRHGWRVGEAGAHAVLASVHAERGRLREARKELDQGKEAARVIPEVPFPALMMACAQFELEHGAADEALAMFLECGERLEASGATNPACAPWRSGAALASARLGDREEADRLLEEELHLAKRFGAPAPIGWALYSQGRLLNGEGAELLREAAELLGEAGRPLDRARALNTLGGVLRRAGKRRESRGPLREALDLAERSGARALAELAQTEIAAAGARPRRTALTGTESLTPRELQVAQLAAAGMPNRRIAEALFVTIKTVEWHLRHAYQKLGIESRKELQEHFSGRE